MIRKLSPVSLSDPLASTQSQGLAFICSLSDLPSIFAFVFGNNCFGVLFMTQILGNRFNNIQKSKMTQNPMQMNDGELKQYIDQVFMKYDKERDGTLKTLEMANYLTQLFQMLGYTGINITPEQAQQAIKMIDKNNDNKITKMELFLTFKELANTQVSEFGDVKIFFMGQGGFDSDNTSANGQNSWGAKNNLGGNVAGWGVNPNAKPWTNSNTNTQNTVTTNTNNTWGAQNTNPGNDWGTSNGTNQNNAWGTPNTNTNSNQNTNTWGVTNNTNPNLAGNNPWGVPSTNTNTNKNVWEAPSPTPNTNNAWGTANTATNSWGMQNNANNSNAWGAPSQNNWGAQNQTNQNSWGQTGNYAPGQNPQQFQPNQAFKGSQQNAWGPQPQQAQNWNQQNRGSAAQQQTFQQQARGSGTQMQPPLYVGGQQNYYNQGQYQQQQQYPYQGWGNQGQRPGTPPSAAYTGNIGIAPLFYDPYGGYRIGSSNNEDGQSTK